jgi:hypothetical protein
MAPRPRPQKCTVGAGADALTLYVVPSQVSPFIGTVTPDAAEDGEEQDQTVPGHQRRRYPGGPVINVAGHERERLVGGYAAKQTLPGKNAWFEQTVGSGASAVRTVRQFTFVGTTKQLRDYVAANAVGNFTLRTPDGEPVPMSDSTP